MLVGRGAGTYPPIVIDKIPTVSLNARSQEPPCCEMTTSCW
ncbi:Uncharacterised protein [Bordetella pertussis]|nr:Uncharacterised protein [Bordetella pertussis]